ncbi:acetylcholine receptor subunit alpha-like 1, partial [Convolutriloba macropyga]|uniref:acetylcholine receptor subunit alpha-like 1 n=1 Tax=Convolutriloba macropyga TaxID=536237 RepID=UPI003F52429A
LNPVPLSYGEILPLPKTRVTNASFYLEQQLLSGYSKRAIPNQNNSAPFWIYTDLTLYQLLELNFRLQMIKVLIWETTHWNDANLKWNPDDFAGITSIRLLDSDVWTPDLVISERILYSTHSTHSFHSSSPLIHSTHAVHSYGPLIPPKYVFLISEKSLLKEKFG